MEIAQSPILQAVVALAAWTMIMWIWMYATRIPAMSRNPKLDPAHMVGSTGTSLRAELPEKVSWKADNYNHLHEAPTVFYAIAILLAITGYGDGMNALLAWIYVGLRVIHSLVQSTSNRSIRQVLWDGRRRRAAWRRSPTSPAAYSHRVRTSPVPSSGLGPRSPAKSSRSQTKKTATSSPSFRVASRSQRPRI